MKHDFQRKKTHIQNEIKQSLKTHAQYPPSDHRGFVRRPPFHRPTKPSMRTGAQPLRLWGPRGQLCGPQRGCSRNYRLDARVK